MRRADRTPCHPLPAIATNPRIGARLARRPWISAASLLAICGTLGVATASTSRASTAEREGVREFRLESVVPRFAVVSTTLEALTPASGACAAVTAAPAAFQPFSSRAMGLAEFWGLCPNGAPLEKIYPLPGSEMRFFYSKKWGWLDLKHLINAASLPLPRAATLAIGELKETVHDSKYDAYSYEDLVSNLIGTFLREYIAGRSNTKPAPTACASTTAFLKELGVVERPLDEAPNAAHIGVTGPMKISPKVFDYYPIYTRYQPGDLNELDLRILAYIRAHATRPPDPQPEY